MGHFFTLGGVLKWGQEEGGQGRRGEDGGRAPGIAAAALCALPTPAHPALKMGEVALEICPVKEIKHVSAKTIFQMGINFSHGAPARLVPEELTAHQ